MRNYWILFALIFAVAAFGQEPVEAPEEAAVMDTVAVDTLAMDDILATDTTAVEAVVTEEDTGDALESLLVEEGTVETEVTGGSASVGYTAGIMAGYPVWKSSGIENYDTPPVYGVIVGSPFGFMAGPFEVGIGAEISFFEFTGKTDGIAALATINTAVYETPQGPISIEIGGGWYGAGVGVTAGATYSYGVPGLPLAVRPYVRANVTLEGGEDLSGNDIGSLGWFNAGLYLSYDISTLF